MVVWNARVWINDIPLFDGLATLSLNFVTVLYYYKVYNKD